jgi:hypothetical protein
MFVKWLSAAAISTIFLICSPSMLSSPLHQVKMRDLNRYDTVGPYTIELKLDAQARANVEADVREFLWNHWHQHRLGHVAVTYYNKEGEPSASSYFVEPDARGIWYIAVKIDRTLIDRGGSKSRHSESVEYDAYSVERIEVPEDGLAQKVMIPETDTRPSTSYRLVLKDQAGKPLTEI